jgi:type IX secretion system PorP/SprF family membrane protein
MNFIKSKIVIMKKTLLIGVLMIASVVNSVAQQIPLYSHYYLNPFLYNPSMAGTKDDANVFFTHRSQWNDMPNSPVTSTLSIDGPIKLKKVGLGLTLFNDKEDLIGKMGASVAYSYRVDINEDNKLYLGLSLGALQNRIDFSRAKLQDYNDNVISTQDQRKAAFDANFGLSYQFQALEVGFSMPQLLGNKFDYTNDETETKFNLSRNYLGSLKYTFMIDEEKNTSVYPLVLVRAGGGGPIQYDINAVFNWQDMAWLGVAYKSDYAIGINVGVKVNKKFTIAYSQEIITSKISAYAGSSSELCLAYTFGVTERKKEPEPKVEETPVKPKEEEPKAQQWEEPVAQPTNDVPKMSDNSNSSEVDDFINEIKKGFEETENPEATDPGTTAATTSPVTTTPADPLDALFKSEKSDDYLDENGNKDPQGFFVVIGSFKNKEFAEKDRDDNIAKGFSDCLIVYSKSKQMYYLAFARTDNNASAKEFLQESLYSGFPEAWVLRLE